MYTDKEARIAQLEHVLTDAALRFQLISLGHPKSTANPVVGAEECRVALDPNLSIQDLVERDNKRMRALPESQTNEQL